MLPREIEFGCLFFVVFQPGSMYHYSGLLGGIWAPQFELESWLAASFDLTMFELTCVTSFIHSSKSKLMAQVVGRWTFVYNLMETPLWSLEFSLGFRASDFDSPLRD